MGVFDAIDIKSGSAVRATLQRGFGPLEAGWFDPVTHAWTLAEGLTRVDAPGLGVSASGVPYFDDEAPTVGEGAQAFVEPVSGTLVLLTGVDA